MTAYSVKLNPTGEAYGVRMAANVFRRELADAVAAHYREHAVVHQRLIQTGGWVAIYDDVDMQRADLVIRWTWTGTEWTGAALANLTAASDEWSASK